MQYHFPGKPITMSGEYDEEMRSFVLKEESQTKRFHYAWVIFALCFLSVFTALGFNSSPKGLYLPAITENLGIPRSLYSIQSTCRYIATAVVNLFFGKLVAKYGPRKLLAAGFVCLTLSNVINALGTNVWYFYLGSVFLGMGLAWTTTSMVGIVVEKWFTSNKGTMMGFILAANGLGGAIASQIFSRIIYSRPDGWRTGFWFSAIVMVIVGTIIVLFVRNEPADRGCTPLGDGTVSKKKQRGRDWIGIAPEDAYRKPYFYICLICVFCTGMVLTCTGTVATPLFRDRGIDIATIANVGTIGSLVLMASKSSMGFIFDRLGLRLTMLICQVCSTVAMICLLIVNNGATAILYTVVQSIALPLETVMLPLIAKECFGQRSYASFMGPIVSFNTLGYAISPPIMNYIFDVTGSYRIGLIATICIMAVITVTMQFVISAAHKERTRIETSVN